MVRVRTVEGGTRRVPPDQAGIRFGGEGQPRDVEIAVSDDGTIPPDLKRAFPLRVDVLLDPAEGFFTLISETKLDLSQQKK